MSDFSPSAFLVKDLALPRWEWQFFSEVFFKVPFTKLYLHSYLWLAGSSLLHAGFLQLWRVGAILSLWCSGFSLVWLLLLRSTGFTSVALVVEYRLGCPWHVGSSWIRNGTHVPCIGGRILHHWTSGEVSSIRFLSPVTASSRGQVCFS